MCQGMSTGQSLSKICTFLLMCIYMRYFRHNLTIFGCTQTVNQLLFAMTVFHNLPEINWLPAVTNFYDQDEDYLEKNVPKTFKNWFAARNIRDNEALVNLEKISCPQIKVTMCVN